MMRPSRFGYLLPILLTGCASGFPGARPLTYATSGEAHVFATGQKCVHEGADTESGGLIAAVLTGAASQLLKNFGSALSEGAKGGALPSSTSTLNLQLDPGAAPKCVVIVRGAFRPSGAATTKVDMSSYLGIGLGDPERESRLEALHLPDIYRIDHYIELRMVASSNGKALTFAPLFVRLGRSIDGATRGERDLSIALKFNRAGSEAAAVGSATVIADRPIGASAEWAPLGNGRYAIEAPWFGTFHAAPALAGTTAAPATPPPAIKPPARPAGNSTRPSRRASAPPPIGPIGAGGTGTGGGVIAPAPTLRPGSTIPSMQSADASATPVTLTATVVETRATNEGLAFLASVFNGIQPKIEETIKPILDSDVRRTANDAEATASLSAQAEYATAAGAAQALRVAYCSAASAENTAAGKQDRINKSKDARNAQLKANVAAIRAELPQPFQALVVISAGSPSAVNAAACSGE